MANIDEYWNQISESDKFKDLDDAQKEKVRNHLWDTYIQKSPSYQNLPLTKRNQVRGHFDQLTKVKPEGFMEEVGRKAKPIIAKGKELAEEASTMVDVTKLPGELEEMGSTTEKIPGMKQAAAGARDIAGRVAGAIEPSEERLGRLSPGPLTLGQAALTPFDMARAIGDGAVRTAGELLAGLYEGGTMGAAALFAPLDAVTKYAGLTFPSLSKERYLPGWKPKTGLSADATKLGDQFEKIITKRRIENNARATNQGPPKPLEVLANEEAKVNSKVEYDQYQTWLENVDKISPSGGEPSGDLYPQAKTNVSQLRDAAKERLQKLQDEPVRVESLSKAEDELQGYYRRRIDQARVYLQPPGPETEPQGLLPAGPEAPKQIGPGEGAKTVPEPSPAAPRTPGPKAAPIQSTGLKAKDVMTRTYSAYYPEQTKQAIGIRVGAALKAFQFKPNEELSEQHLNMIEKFMEQEHADYLKQNQPTPRKASQVPSQTSEVTRLREKGLDPIEVTSEVKRLQQEHESMRGITDYEDTIKSEGGLAMDPKLKAEHLRNVPIHLRGNVLPDDMAQRLFDQNLQEDASASTMYRKLSERKMAGQPRSQRSFLDEAEHNIEHQKQVEAGFEEDLSLRGEKAGEAGPVQGAGGFQEIIPGTASQFPDQKLKDIKNESTFNIVSDIGRHFLGERGQLGGGDLDPVRQAALEAAVNELVDRAMALGYQTTQDIMVYAARNAPKELQDALRKNLAPTLSPFDDHAYKEMDSAKKGNAVAKKSMMDSAQHGYFQKKLDILKGTYRKFKANQQIVLFKDMDEGLMRLQNDLFIHDNYRKFSKDELAAQRWFTEGKSPKLESLTKLGVPEDTAKRWLDLAKNPTENMKNARKMTQVNEDEYYDLLSEYYDRVGYREDHVTRRWKRPDEYMDWEGRTLSNRPNFLKGAKLLSQAQGIDAGLEPVSFDIREDLRASNNARVNILSRIHAYQKLGASFGPDGMPAIMDESAEGAPSMARNAKITPHRGEAPPSWIRTQSVPLLRDLAIHPYYKSALQYMLARPFRGSAVEVINLLAASSKATKLIGFFHGLNITEMGLTGIKYRDVFSFSKNRNVLYKLLRYTAKSMTADMEGEAFSKNPGKAVAQLYKSFMTGSGVLANRPLALEMAEANFKFGASDGEMYNILSRFLSKTETELAKKIGDNPSKALMFLPRTAVDLTNKSIFSYARPIWSMIVYESNLADSIKKFNLDMPEGQKIPIDQIKQAVVNATSKEMGGIAWSRMMARPKTQQILQWAFLAPEWKIAQYLRGASLFSKGPEGRQTRRQMVSLVVGWYLTSEMANYARTKAVLGKGRWLEDNPKGYKSQVFLNKNARGETYIAVSKNLTDMFDDFMHPGQVASRAQSPMVRAAASVMNWMGDTSYHAGAKPENPLMALVHAYQPMFSSGSTAYGVFPTHRGPSKNKVEAILDQYYRGGMKDGALFREAMQTGIEQGYDMSKLNSYVKANRTKEKNKALFR